MHPDETHNEELNQAPLLRSFHRQFKQEEESLDIPEGYFEQMQLELLDQIEEDGLLDAAPNLKAAGRVFPFQIPKDYFQLLPERVMRGIHRQGRVIPMWQRFRYAAVSLAAALLTLFLLRQASPGSYVDEVKGELAWEQIATEDLVALALEDGYDSELILEVMGEASLKELPSEETPTREDEGPELEQLLDEIDLEDLEDVWLDEGPLDG